MARDSTVSFRLQYSHARARRTRGTLPSGSCARGFKEEANQSADLIYTTTDIRADYQGQYFWEAFPAVGRGFTRHHATGTQMHREDLTLSQNKYCRGGTQLIV